MSLLNSSVETVGNRTDMQLEEEFGMRMLSGLTRYFLIWYLPLILTIGTFGAVFCMLFIFMSRMFPKIIQVWLVSICFGDFMILIWDVLRLFLKLAFGYDYIDQGVVICKLQSYFSSFFFHWSAYNQAAMSIQRLVFIASPLRSRTILNTKRVMTTWATMTFLLLFPNITYLIYWHIGRKSDCEPVDKWFYYVTTLVHLIAWGIIPLASMVVSTGCISYRLIRYRRGNFKAAKTKDGRGSDVGGGVPQPAVIGGRRHGSDQNAHVTRLLVSMNLFYLFTTFPLLIYMMYLNFVKDNQVGKSIAKSLHKFYYYLFRSICFLNASLNWVFYCAAGKVFRQKAMQILYRIFCREKSQYRGGGRFTTTYTQAAQRHGQRSTSATPVAFQQTRRADTLAGSSELVEDAEPAPPDVGMIKGRKRLHVAALAAAKRSEADGVDEAEL
ncbi:hypothetical protein BOX15_Mlig001214g1 [Macrostomum lignano]|uniref:G-protein coupled receptors family 1 profile domain-containing protein n=1 Tax=Macrostomum lignano TaxID=282301 RepID=A0A267DN13_9PLAT|nr:hypothetical protein BOX15_Mlig001214g1 [Macrostomum lignano]